MPPHRPVRAPYYGVTGDPRTNEIVAVDVATAAETSPAWNLDLIPVGEFPVAVEYADH